MSESELELRFDPQTINHLGLRMYSTLPPALAEIISNSYDADAETVSISLQESNGTPESITVEDDGIGLSLEDIKEKFLVIGRNRRLDDGDIRSPKFQRLPTGKKGLGKLALFGLATSINIVTRKEGLLNEFVLDWHELMKKQGVYNPRLIKMNQPTEKASGTSIFLTGLKRKSPFDFEGLANSISKIFIFDDNFNVTIESPSGDRIVIDNKRKYRDLEKQFEWDLSSTLLVPESSSYAGRIEGHLITSVFPIAPQSGLRGITLYSRGKLVNAPEYFSSSTSSHFYQYLTGWISVNFIDLLDEDVISTNRQSLNWENPEMKKLRAFLSGIISQVNIDWRRQRKAKRDEDLKANTGINTSAWLNTMPSDVKSNTQRIIESLGGEDALEQYTPIIKALHELVPEYPLLHWRHLHKEIQDKSRKYYENRDYYTAFLEAMKKYRNVVQEKSASTVSPDHSMMGSVFNEKVKPFLDVARKFKKGDGSDFTDDTYDKIQSGQRELSQGIVSGARNPLSHEEIEDLKMSGLFSEKDCLDMLSLLSHLFNRLDNSTKIV